MVDEAIGLAHTVCSGNPNSLCFLMLPQHHTSTSKATVLKNRRLMEDKVGGRLGHRVELSEECVILGEFFGAWGFLRVMNTYDIALSYQITQHGGDRRKTSQQCNFFETCSPNV